MTEWLWCLPFSREVLSRVTNTIPLDETSTGWFHEADPRVIYMSCENLFHNRAKISMFKVIIEQMARAILLFVIL